MVAIVTGNSLGLAGSSANVLGSGGQFGTAATGLGGDAAYVNAKTGNLTISRQDELLIGRGPDIGVVRTYNSNGTFDFDNNDNWQLSLYRQIASVTGGTGVNTAGSSLTRTGADGALLTYTYDSTAGSPTLGKYVNKDGSGSYDTLSYASGTNQWTWTDGNTRTTETYAVNPTDSTKWRITNVADLDGNSLTYTYDATTGVITQVTDANGESTQLIYNAAKQLLQINEVNSSNVTTTRIRYTYDSNTPSRLISVSTDLTPADGSIADGKTYTTSYSYDGTSNRITQILNSDGSSTSFTYYTSGTYINRINTITDGTGNATTLAYTSNTATITDASGQVTTLTYSTAADNSNGQLTNLTGPAGSGQNITYSYNPNGNGDVTQVTDSRGNWVKYTYDIQGNQLSQQDIAGNTITRTFGSLNELLTETVYASPDAAPTDTTLAATLPQTTRYVYGADGKDHLRFIISPEGRVTEYRYNTAGQRTSEISYTNNLYAVASLTVTQTQTEAQMTTWLTAAIKTKSERTDYTYDLRGQLSNKTVFTQVSSVAGSEGTGLASGQMVTQYVYDQSGNLLQTIDARSGVTNYTYDGLNRITTKTDAIITNPPTVTVYNDATRQVVVTLANGLSTTSTYDQAGRLLSVAKNDASGALGTSSYRYDALGNLRQVTDPLNQKSYYIYDSANRVVGQIDENGYLTETIYNSNNQVVRTIRYANQVATAPTDVNALTITLASVRPTVDTTNDRTTRNLYDKAGRLAKQIDALGVVTEYTYDGVSRLIKTTQYTNALTPTQLTAIAALGTELLPTDSNTIPVASSTTDRITRQLYSDDGLLVGTLSAEGYLTEYTYDAAGQRLQAIRYVTLSPSAQWAAGTLTNLRPTAAAADQKTSYIYNAASQLIGMVDAENFLTTYAYDLSGNLTTTTRYKNAMVGTLASNTMPQILAAAGTGNYVVTNTEDQTQSSTYDANNRLTQTTSSPDGLITQYVYDSVGNLTTSTKTYTGATATQQRAQQFRYNSLGQLTAQLSGEGVIALIGLGSTPTQTQIDTIWNTYGTRYSYDLAGHRISMITSNGTIDGIGNKTLYYYDNEGKLVYSINALGEVSQNTYNAFDQVTATRQYATRLSAATLSSLTGGLASSLGTTITSLVSGGYSETLVGYDRDGQITSLTDALGNVNSRTYNLFGELASRTDKIDASNTVTTSYTYDRRGLQVSTTEDSGGIGRVTSALYDAFGRITQTTDGRGGLIKHIYDRLGREVTTTDALNTNTLTTYDAFSRILTQVDGRNNTTTYSYNSTNRTMTMTSAEGISLTTEKNRYGETVKLTDGRNNITTYSYNANGQLTGVLNADGTTTTTGYDVAGRVVSVFDARGKTTQYTYDAANRLLTQLVDPANLELTTSYRYDALGRQIWTQDANGIWTRTDYDAKGQVTAITQDPLQIPNYAGTLVANASGLNLQTTYTYDARGKRLTVTEGAGSSQPRTTQYVYDKLGRRIQSIIDPHIIVTDSKLAITTSYAYDKNDNLVLKTDANGNKTVYTYDADNQQTATIDALGYVTKRDYDLNGNVLTITAYGTAMTAANLTTIQTNAANGAQMNIATSTSQAVSVSGSTVTITVATSATVDRISRSVYDKDNRLTFSIDAAGYVTQLAYDATGNVVKRTRYANAIVTPAAGVAPSILAAAGTSNYVITSTSDRVEQTVYDTMNRATVNVDAAGYVTAYSYDANGNLLSSTRYANLMQGTLVTNTAPSFVSTTGNYVVPNPTKDQVTTNTYDILNRRATTVDAEGYLTEYDYDGLGQLSATVRYSNKASLVSGSYVVTPDGTKDQVTNFNHDNAGRITVEVRNVGTAAESRISYSYDAVGNRTDSIQNGVTTHYVYDTAGRVTDETHGYGTTAATTTHYDYDALGHQVKISEGYGTASLRITQQFFDLIGQKTQAKDALNNSTITTYNAFGDIVKVMDARGASGYFYTDALGRVTLQLMPEGTTPAENNYAAVASTYDAFGNLTGTLRYATRITAAVSTGTLPTLTAVPASDQKQAFAYDKLNRKTTVQTWTGPTTSTASTDYYTESFSYDAYSNVLTSTARNGAITSYTYDKLGRKLTETLPVQARNASNVLVNVQNTFAYDANGNLTTKTEAYGLPEARTTTYTYDQLGRQRTESVDVGQTYNASSNTTSINPATKTTTYDGRGNITSSQDANGNTTYYYYDALDRKVGQVDAAKVYTSYSYDVVGNKTSQTVYATQVATAVIGTAPSVVVDSANDRTTLYAYDLVGRQTGTTIQNIVYGYVDNANNYQVLTGSITTQTVYDALGNITKTIDANGNITRTWYNNAGQTVAQVDALGYLTTWTRDVYGNISQETRYTNKAQTMGTATLDTGIPQILTAAPAAGSNAVYVLSDATNDRTTVITFDKLNRVKTETVLNVVSGTVNATTGVLTANAATVSAITTYTYDGLNNVTQKTDAVGAITNFVYDNLGRQVSELDPTFTDYTGASVRPETDKEYDGLGNVKREIVRGTNNTATTTTNSGQIETDDHITTYTYTNGRLTAQVDPAGIRTEYQYDANGNVTKKTLKNRQTADQQINNQAGTDDVTTYSYDSLNRQLSTKDFGTGLISEVQYNSFGQITGKRSYVINAQNPTAPTSWTEFAQYDQAGRLWKNNSSDGVVKVYVADKNGNVSLKITSSDNTNLISLVEDKLTGTNNLSDFLAAPNTLRIMSVYDAKNQLIKTIQALMDSNRQLGAIVTSASSNTLSDTVNPLTSSVAAAQVISPINAGSIGISGGADSFGGTATEGVYEWADWLNADWFHERYHFTKFPSTDALGGGAIEIVNIGLNNPYVLSSSTASAITTGQPVDFVWESMEDEMNGVEAPQYMTFNVYKILGTGEKIALVSNLLMTLSYSTGNNFYKAVSLPKKIYINNQPPTTSKVLFSYRAVGSNAAYTTVSVPSLISTTGTAVAGYYAFDWGSIPSGNYEYQYVALSSTGAILNQQGGSFNTTVATAPTISTQSSISLGGLGRAFVTNASSTGLSTNGLQLIDQGSNAANVTMKYRVKNSNATWSVISPSSFTTGTTTTGYGPGSFTLSTSNLSVFANATTYEVEFEIRDSSNNLLRITSSEISRDATGVIAGAIPLNLKKIRLGAQPTTAAYVDISFRSVGSSSAYSTPIRIYPTTTGSGLFDWDITAIPSGNQDVAIKSYDSSNNLINSYQSYISFGVNSAVVNAITSVINPRYITINPPNPANVDYVVAGYRLKNTTVDFTPLPMSTTVVNGGVKEFRITIPILAAGDYEYQYTAYGPDTDNYVDPENITITPPPGTPVGTTNIDVKYAVKVNIPANPPSGYVPPTPIYNTVSTTAITSINGVTQYRLNLPSPLAKNEYVFEYKTYTYVSDVNDPNFGTYQWTLPTVGEFTSRILTTSLGSNIGEFSVQANSTTVSNTQSQWQWTSPTSTLITIQHQQSFNAFGEIVTETDGRGNVTQSSYNTLGKLTKKQDPNVSITLDNGFKQNVSPQTIYTYDLIGRLVGTTDANGNLNVQSWLNGGTGAQTGFERHADTGFIKRGYDIFGNKRTETDRINSLTDTNGRTTAFTYDNDDLLIDIMRPSGVHDHYTYDQAGQRIIHSNVLGDTEATYFDSLGRVTKTRSYMGFATNYTYSYTSNVVGLAGVVVTGWINTVTDAVGRTTVDTTDMFNRTFKHKDLGNNVFNYNYNQAGWLTDQTSSTGQNILYSHYANGYIKSIQDKALGMYTFYEYDANGNKSFEGYVSLKDSNNVAAGYKDYYQQATVSYDSLNRITKIEDPKAKIEYEYDAVGNRRMVRSEYKDGINGALQVQEYWYKYDSMNRFLITMGQLPKNASGVTLRGTSATDTTKAISAGPLGSDGVSISYNVAGERVQALIAKNNNTEVYSYSTDGYLKDVTINGVLRSRRTNDVLGRVTNMTEYAANSTVSYSITTTYDKDNRTLSQVDNSGSKTTFAYYGNDKDSSYSSAGAGALAYTHNDSDGDGNNSTGVIVDTYYGYEYWDEAKMTAITADPYSRSIQNNDRKWKDGYSDITYDVNGHISGAIDRQGKRNFRYVSDAQGLVLVRDEITGTIDRPNYSFYASTYNPGSVSNKVQRFYYLDGRAVGAVGNDGPSRTDYVQSMANRSAPNGNYAGWKPVASADFDQNYEPISPTNPGPVAGTYTVKQGDTLQGIAQQVWGDSSMWYLLADANGMTSAQPLIPNMVLTIPNKVTNVHNNSGTFRPYNPGEAIGDLNPTLPAMPKPPQKHGGCGGLGMILVAVVAVAATIATAGALAGPAAIATNGLFGAGVAALGGAGTIGFAAGAVAGAVGSIAGQIAGNALGVQSGFSWGAVAAGAIGAGLGASGALPSFGGNALQQAGNAAVRNVVSQGVGIITGQQKGFSWSSLAVSAVTAPIANKITNQLNSSVFSNELSRTALGFTGGLVASTVSQITRMTLDGGKLNWVAVASDGLTGAIEAWSEGANKAVNTKQVGGRIVLDGDNASGITFTQSQRDKLSAQWDDGITNTVSMRNINSLPLTGSNDLNLDATSIIKEKLAAGDYAKADILIDKRPRAFGPAVYSVSRDEIKNGVGYLETAATITTGIFGNIAGGINGAATILLTGDADAGAAVMEGTRNKLTYLPKTDSGQESLSNFGNFVAPIGKFVQNVEQGSGDIGYNLSGSPFVGALFSAAPDAALMFLGPGGSAARSSVANVSRSTIVGVGGAGKFLLEGLSETAYKPGSMGSMLTGDWAKMYAVPPETWVSGHLRAADKGFLGVGKTANGGPTFAGTDYLYPVEAGQKNIVNIMLKGNYPADFSAANKAAGFEVRPDGYTWHHLDDFNPVTGTSTLELVAKDAHIATTPHRGSARQYFELNGKGYGYKK